MSSANVLRAPAFRTVRLHGALGEKYGREFRIIANSPAMAIRMLGYQLRTRGFINDLHKGNFVILRGGLEIQELDDLNITFGKTIDMDIVPAMEGEGGTSRGAGMAKIFIGAAIVGLSFGFAAPFAGGLGAGTFGLGAGIGGVTFAQTAAFGGLVLASGLAMVATPTPRMNDQRQLDKPEQRASSFFNSQVNNSEQGCVVPILIGRLHVGMIPVSGSIHVGQVPLAEILDDEITAESLHWMNGPETSIPAIAREYRGFNNVVLVDYADEQTMYGAFELQAFRESLVMQVIEYRDTGTDEHFLQVTMLGKRPRNYFDIVTIMNADQTTDFLQKATTLATYANDTDVIITTGKPAFVTRWRWSLGTGVPWQIPNDQPGNLFRVRFDY